MIIFTRIKDVEFLTRILRFVDLSNKNAHYEDERNCICFDNFKYWVIYWGDDRQYTQTIERKTIASPVSSQ